MPVSCRQSLIAIDACGLGINQSRNRVEATPHYKRRRLRRDNKHMTQQLPAVCVGSVVALTPLGQRDSFKTVCNAAQTQPPGVLHAS
jgi:hypothetical protein